MLHVFTVLARWAVIVLGICAGHQRVSAADTAAALGRAYEQSGPHRVESSLFDWPDSARNRTVPVKIYRPADLDTLKSPAPVILFSHGLGGSRDGYSYIGQHWASHGYVCVHLQHPGSDSGVWQGKAGQAMAAMRAAAADPRNALNRVMDVRFAIDQVEKLNKDDPVFKGRLDLAHIGMAGHSFGAYTTLASSGQAAVGPLGRDTALPDPRIKAAMPMSPTPPKRQDPDVLQKTYAKIAIPMFHMTGTRDDSPINDARAADRRIPFDHITGPEQFLVIYKDGDHAIFAGGRRPGLLAGRTAGATPGTSDDVFHALIRQSSTAFWNAFLKGDDQAKKWLADGGFKSALGDTGTFEHKPPKNAATPGR